MANSYLEACLPVCLPAKRVHAAAIMYQSWLVEWKGVALPAGRGNGKDGSLTIYRLPASLQLWPKCTSVQLP